jgi:hypothetical protein
LFEKLILRALRARKINFLNGFLVSLPTKSVLRVSLAIREIFKISAGQDAYAAGILACGFAFWFKLR